VTKLTLEQYEKRVAAVMKYIEAEFSYTGYTEWGDRSDIVLEEIKEILYPDPETPDYSKLTFTVGPMQ
jgi:hypothetical protein